MLSITRQFTFAYAHQLYDHEGLCKNLHGHTGILEVEIQAEQKEEGSSKGMIIDFIDLKEIVEKEVLSQLDHAYLNDIILTPTAENITMWIVEKLTPIFKETLVRIRVYESQNAYAEWRRS